MMKPKSFLDFIRTKYFWTNLLGGLFFLVFVFFIFLKSLDFITRHGEEIEVPKLIGKNLAMGIQQLKDLNLEVKIDSVFVAGKEGGEIVDQNPNPGDMVKEHRSIYLTIVKFSAPLVSLPAFEDLPYKEFESNLLNLGIQVDSIIYTPDIAKDLVLGVHFQGKRIEAGIKLPKGSKIDLVLGDGEGGPLVQLPNLIGLKLDEARFAIRGSQLVLGNINYQGNITDSSQVKVIQQSPNFRSDSLVKVGQGTIIHLVLAQPGL